MAYSKKTTEPLKIKIGNTIIEKGRKYILDHKFDGDAPSGLKSIEATRLPFAKNVIVDCIAFDDRAKVYDTGFYAQSPCLASYKLAEREELTATYIKEIKAPFENFANVSLEKNADNQFLKDFRYDLYVNREFDTNEPQDMFELFCALLQGYVCNKDEKDPRYRALAQFNISNPQDVKNKSKEKTKKRRQAFEKFSIMADSNRDKLDLVLEYIGRDNPAKVEADDLKDSYYEAFHDVKNGTELVDRFVEATAKYDLPRGEEEMEYYSLAKRLYKAGKIKKTKKGFETLTGEQFLGITFQDIAKFCMNTDSIQSKIILELRDELPN